MSSKKKTPSLGQGAHGDLREILAGMAQLLEWMDQLVMAALEHEAVPAADATRSAAGRKRAEPRKRHAAKRTDRRSK